MPIVTLTLWTRDPARGGHELGQVARAIETEIKRVPGTRNVYTVGGAESAVRVSSSIRRSSPATASTVEELRRGRSQAANVVQHAGTLVGDDRVTPVDAGTFLANRDDVAGLVVAARDGRPVYLDDVADRHRRAADAGLLRVVRHRPGAPQRGLARVAHGAGRDARDLEEARQNAIDVARSVIERIEAAARASTFPKASRSPSRATTA